jgi:hypothetical protein
MVEHLPIKFEALSTNPIPPKRKKKKNEIISFAEKWMEVKTIILSEINQLKKTCCMFFFIYGI